MDNLSKKIKTLKFLLKNMGSVLIAYSGGVDSSFLLKIAKDVLKDKVLAVTAKSLTYPQREIRQAKAFINNIRVRHLIITTSELQDENFVRNDKDRCYWCKRELFRKLLNIAKERKISYVLEASNLDDLKDYRPGLRAIKELGIKSPLIEAGLRKGEIRSYSKKLGLPTYNKPSFACLASRIPYGRRIDKETLVKIDKAEDFLIKIGIRQLRIRDHGRLARVEVLKEDFPKVIRNRTKIIKYLQKLGYLFITLDLEGYTSGSMNRVLRLKSR